jgi:hypothetical protein
MRRWLGPIGLLAAVLIFIGIGPLGGNLPGENASGVTVAHYVNTHVGQSWASIYLVGAGLALMTVFLVGVHSVLRLSGQKVLPNAMFAAAVIFVTSFVLTGMFQVILILAAHSHEYSIVHTINFASDNSELGFVFGLALVTLTTGLTILLQRERLALPKTLGWYSLLVFVVACAGPLSGFDFLFGLPIWVIAVGFVISTKERRGTLAPSGDGGGASISSSNMGQPVAA